MSINKQTVWLITMLSIMVVLSAYYIVTGPVEPVGQEASRSEKAAKGINVDIKPVDQPAASEKDILKQQNDDDYFVGYQLERSTLRQKMVEDYMKVLTNPDASDQDLKEANSKIQQLMKVDNQETVLEDLIRKQGYSDAVVVTNNPHVDVVVQSDKLTPQQVVKLISLVRQHLNVSPQHVSVAYRQ
ncbi:MULTISPECIES: SpoIIIAH-like family protein [Thermoactinomyces]|jgi:stage III sporulation protein AH|uniref:SpoIIIAH-like family protein n=1 Tax=Thermoactinomyces daqus TaxID=1329516 RepID=A0A7W1XAD5_9BACL|nr:MULTISPECIES: SpoIIIAH-like family protein [Thermoactinomyces]MBA4542977.1 SpoIIIAH-like family protein [Thermoactinomyces daqus]MBH8596749.1 SpoIIIAH-like family protein [Thermoactinomyces sp. CICC 10523]MBH8603511.1 SpoIIIAH-like family protein [Thermoactinomyces sp. CICC 10522]MBH8606675.1 SpoIIIAH-like family protein [Thermoactinomyces sp. CICC 10521]